MWLVPLDGWSYNKFYKYNSKFSHTKWSTVSYSLCCDLCIYEYIGFRCFVTELSSTNNCVSARVCPKANLPTLISQTPVGNTNQIVTLSISNFYIWTPWITNNGSVIVHFQIQTNADFDAEDGYTFGYR